jgi:hypothetical protein
MVASVQFDGSFVKALSDAYGGAIFLVTRGAAADAPISLHVTGPGDTKRLDKAWRHLVGGRFVVRRHAAELLAAPRNLQSLMTTLTEGEVILADPTGAVTRSEQLVRTARLARAAMPRRLRGLYFNPSRGLVFAWMREPPAAEDGRAAMEAVLAEAGADWACVILSPVLPTLGLVAVDAASARSVAAERGRTRLARILTTAAAAVGLSGALAGVATAEMAPSDPLYQAVFTAGGGGEHGKAFGSVDGSVGAYGTFFGQVDAKGFGATGDDGGGVALQLGLRNPAVYRAGVFVAAESAAGRFLLSGAKGDLFVGPVNLHLVAGDLAVQNGVNKGFGGGGADFYLNDDTKLFAKGVDDGRDGWGAAGIEHTFQSLAGLTLGGAGTFGSDHDGFKVYAKWWFGAPHRSLKGNDRAGPADSVMDDGWFSEVKHLKKHPQPTYGGGTYGGGY